MKELFINTISRGGYDLADMLAKIDSYYIEGKLTTDEKDELYELARNNSINQYDYPKEIEALWKTVKILQSKVEILENAGDTENNDSVDLEAGQENESEAGAETSETYPEYVQPTGAHDAYMTGDIISFNGMIYKCIMDYCVYNPHVYPAAWEVVEE